MQLSVIIPCHNEAENVPKIERELFPVLERLAVEGGGGGDLRR